MRPATTVLLHQAHENQGISERSENSGNLVETSRQAPGRLGHFPEFTPVSEVSAAEFAGAIHGHLPYSTFNYVSLRSYWPEAQATRIGDGVALLITDTNDQSPFLTILSNGRDHRYTQSLIDYGDERGIGTILRLVPECSLCHLPEGLKRLERRDGFDYIISLDAVLDPGTPELVRKHQQAHDCLSAHPGLVVCEVAVDSSTTRSALQEIDQSWHSARKGSDTNAWEQRAFLRCLSNQADFALNAMLAIGEDGTPLGFTLNENLHNGYYMAHFGKTRPGLAGLSELLEIETARHMARLGCRFMNFQEDLGNHGLRRMKQSWNPYRMLRVFDVVVPQ